MPPAERHCRRPTVHFEHLPRERRHHPLERLVAAGEVRVLGAVVLVRADDGVVRPRLEHVLCGLGVGAVDGEGVVCMVDGAPVCEVLFEGCFDFPVFDEVLDERGEGVGGVGLLLCW
jgi:hypothetical protein